MMIFQDSIQTIQSQGEMHDAVFTQEKEYKDSIQTIQSPGFYKVVLSVVGPSGDAAKNLPWSSSSR